MIKQNDTPDMVHLLIVTGTKLFNDKVIGDWRSIGVSGKRELKVCQTDLKCWP